MAHLTIINRAPWALVHVANDDSLDSPERVPASERTSWDDADSGILTYRIDEDAGSPAAGDSVTLVWHTKNGRVVVSARDIGRHLRVMHDEVSGAWIVAVRRRRSLLPPKRRRLVTVAAALISLALCSSLGVALALQGASSISPPPRSRVVPGATPTDTATVRPIVTHTVTVVTPTTGPTVSPVTPDPCATTANCPPSPICTTPPCGNPPSPSCPNPAGCPPTVQLNSDPAAISWGPGRADLFVRGAQNDILHRWWDGTWHPWESLGGSFLSKPAVSSWGVGRLDVFGIGQDSAMWHGWWDTSAGGGWHVWERLGGFFTSGPAAVSWGPNRIDVFGRGGDNAIYHSYWDSSLGEGWHGWESLGGGFLYAPAVASWGFGRLDVFGVGLNHGMWHGWQDVSVPGGWHLWESLGGYFTSDIAAFSPLWEPGGCIKVRTVAVAPPLPYACNQRIDMFGRGNDNAMWHGDWNVNGWQLYSSLHGAFSSGPTVVEMPDGSLADEVFAIGSDGKLQSSSGSISTTATASAWGPWTPLP